MARYIFDEATLIRHKKQTKIQKERQKILDYITEQEKLIVKLNDKDNFDPTNAEKQLGQGLLCNDFEKRIKKLLPDCFFMNNPQKANIRWLFTNENGEKRFVCSYDNGFMPEHSIMRKHEEDLIDADIITGKKSLDRKDLPSWDFVPGKGIVFLGQNPGLRKVNQIWGEQKRGWRTVLLYLLKQNILTIQQIENVFGSSNDKQWSGHTGKQSLGLTY